MKANVLTSVLVAVFFVSTTAFANSPKTKMYTNNEYRDNGCTKEYIFVDDESRPEMKSVYEYTTDGNLQEKVTYKWNTEKGWVAIQKYTYEYNKNGQISNMIYTEWNKELQAWSHESQHMLHIYDLDGELLSVHSVEN